MASGKGMLFRRAVSIIPSPEENEPGNDTESVSSDESIVFSQKAFCSNGKRQFNDLVASASEGEVLNSRQKSALGKCVTVKSMHLFYLYMLR